MNVCDLWCPKTSLSSRLNCTMRLLLTCGSLIFHCYAFVWVAITVYTTVGSLSVGWYVMYQRTWLSCSVSLYKFKNRAKCCPRYRHWGPVFHHQLNEIKPSSIVTKRRQCVCVSVCLSVSYMVIYCHLENASAVFPCWCCTVSVEMVRHWTHMCCMISATQGVLRLPSQPRVDSRTVWLMQPHIECFWSTQTWIKLYSKTNGQTDACCRNNLPQKQPAAETTYYLLLEASNAQNL